MFLCVCLACNLTCIQLSSTDFDYSKKQGLRTLDSIELPVQCIFLLQYLKKVFYTLADFEFFLISSCLYNLDCQVYSV